MKIYAFTTIWISTILTSDIFSHFVQTKDVLFARSSLPEWRKDISFACHFPLPKVSNPGIFSSFWKSISNAPFPGDLSCFMQWHWHHAGLCWALSACCYCYVPLVIFLCINSLWIFLMKNIIGVYSLHRVMGFIKTFSFNSIVCFKQIPWSSPFFSPSPQVFFLPFLFLNCLQPLPSLKNISLFLFLSFLNIGVIPRMVMANGPLHTS